MQTKIISPSTAENISAALEDIGFTITQESGVAKCYWGNDSNNKIYLNISPYQTTNIKIYFCNSNNTVLGSDLAFGQSNTIKMTYELIGNGIVFGFLLTSNAYERLHFGIIAPIEQDDDWQYVYFYKNGNQNYVTNGRTEISSLFKTTSLYDGNPLGIQIVKHYNGINFVNNVYITTVAEDTVASATDTSGNNFYEATINNDTYLIICLTNTKTNNKIAIKKVTTP